METDSSKETVGLRTNVDLLRPTARSYSIKGQAKDAADSEKAKYTLIRDSEDFQMGIYDKPLPFYGCGIGWFSFLIGFLCPPMWYYGAILYFGNHYRKDPRERAGLGASAIAVKPTELEHLYTLLVVMVALQTGYGILAIQALLCSVVLLIIAAILLSKLQSLRSVVQY